MGIKSSSQESPPAGEVETLEKEPGRLRKDNDMKGYTKERREAVIAKMTVIAKKEAKAAQKDTKIPFSNDS